MYNSLSKKLNNKTLQKLKPTVLHVHIIHIHFGIY